MIKITNELFLKEVNNLLEEGNLVERLKGAFDLSDEINKISTGISSENLKLHDISHRLYQYEKDGLISNSESVDIFQHIIDVEYDSFTDWEDENLNIVERNYIGRTSGFYYMPKNTGFEEVFKGETFQYKDHLESMFHSAQEEAIYSVATNNIDKEELESIIADYLSDIEDMDDFQNEISDMVEDFSSTLDLFQEEVEFLKEELEEAKKAYDYIKDFKTEENEYYMADEHLSVDIENHLTENKAHEITDNFIEAVGINNIKVKDIEVSGSLVEIKYEKEGLEKSWKQDLKIKNTVNDKVFNLYIKILKEELEKSLFS